MSRATLPVKRLCILLLALLASLATTVHAAPSGLRSRLANPGRPLDLVLNRDAKRKTASVVTVNGLERTFGADAISISSRFPENSFFAVRNLLGLPYDSEDAAEYRKQFSNKMVKEPEQGTVAFQYGALANETLTVQDIVAMQLQHAKQLVKESEGIEVKDVVLTIPSFFTQSQRLAMLDAANIAGFRVLAMVNDGSAVALNYGMNREFQKAEKHVFYDMGAGKTVATVAGFHVRASSKLTKASKKSTIVNVSAHASDTSLGGQQLDFILRDLLAQNARAMNRLLKEAKRVKAILSANVETDASIEGSASKHLVSRIRGPIDEALKAANTTLDQIDSIVLVGGGTRVPFVQQALADAFGADKLSKNVNAEEASVMGAVFKAATLSSQFRVRDVRLRDAMPFAVRSTHATEQKTMLGSTKYDTAYLYPDYAAIGARRLIPRVACRGRPDDSWSKLATATVSGVAGAKGKLKGKSPVNEVPEVKITVQANEFGVFEVSKAEALFNVTNPKHAEYVADLELWTQESASIEAEASSASEAEKTATEDWARTKTKLRAKPTAQPEHILEVVPLELSVDYHGIRKLSNSSLKSSRALLRRMDDSDSARIAHHRATNELESLIYHLRDTIEEDDVASVTTEAQREALLTAVQDASEWLEDYAEKASAENLTTVYRNEYTAQELEPVADLLEDLEDTLDSTASWLDQMVAKQEALHAHEDPVLTTDAMDAKALAIERSLARLIAKKVKKIKVETTVDEDGEEAKANAEEQTEPAAQDAGAAEEPVQADDNDQQNQHDEL
ncbi:actin-like ATPase domain-containing protein [Linderina pennispora]|uniref:Actin-like ATPase domain-containing protein n=1 Tax=Linderina pennispora TaxID=61395 RepID=A0A1Y1WKY9_9FUNG|nr:actin-like ATPase domain-containing protein [Linderina pennispora]ORX74162.1 actin-like ATPase domain-containing protein [Linderina pennispora]